MNQGLRDCGSSLGSNDCPKSKDRKAYQVPGSRYSKKTVNSLRSMLHGPPRKTGHGSEKTKQ